MDPEPASDAAIPRQSLTSAVADKLRDQIIRGEILEGVQVLSKTAPITGRRCSPRHLRRRRNEDRPFPTHNDCESAAGVSYEVENFAEFDEPVHQPLRTLMVHVIVAGAVNVVCL
jgi:hypothetical protein